MYKRQVEIHGAHGYLLTNFFSPTTNHRTDLYGGMLENRMRIYIEIARDVRKKVGPDFPVTIRLSGTAVSYTHLDVYKRQGQVDGRQHESCPCSRVRSGHEALAA